MLIDKEEKANATVADNNQRDDDRGEERRDN